ncbi:unnamed protein product [Tilletia laevis]|uniref:Tc1-like transposase DDE domain-containing protein n=2 Tax=Tilletia TaxID=13289 RepID=A0A177U7Y9_9BASI|nr:hypothetical protein CF335_g6960 [Tilletia laevis]KAE8248979.1 hypothetical protein A4X03_0g6682 [Tilletia caries]CAD6892666.1 unnamed protein product [Tilletia caries]CAD6917942.1 unnamed protein product [Tilletia caries]CAD6956196.1 unnamed protein product [Tilletia caries]
MISTEIKLYAAEKVVAGHLAVKTAAQPHMISESTVKRSIRDLRQTNTIRAPLPRSGRPKALSQQEVIYVLALIHHRPTIYLDEIADMIQFEFNHKVALSTISRLLSSLGYTNKKLTRVARQRDSERRRRHMLFFAQFDPRQLIFADETHADNKANQRTRGWARQGSRAVDIDIFLRGQRYTLLPALAYDGICCPWVVPDSVNGDRFLYWVQHILLPTMNPWPGPRSVLVVDNCPTHKGVEVRRVVQEAGCNLIFLPPYSPDLNPIEFAFSSIKRHLRRHPANDELDLVQACYNAVTKEHAKAYFQASGYGDREI